MLRTVKAVDKEEYKKEWRHCKEKKCSESDWRVTPGMLRDFRMSKTRPRHLFISKVVPGKSQKDTLKDVTFRFQRRSSFLQISFRRVKKKCRWSEEELFLGSWGKWEQEEKSHLRVSNDPTAQRTNWEAELREEERWFDTWGKEKSSRKRTNGRDTYFKLYLQSEPGRLTERREFEMFFESGRNVCVCVCVLGWCRSLLSWNQHAQFSRFTQ